jgi:ABC-type multidrug transport system ATPase subunit
MSFQYPPEIPGISNTTFLQACLNAKRKAHNLEPLSDEAFKQVLKEKMSLIEAKADLETRNLNEGFSGGEKKRNEILQMAILEPRYAILDETDSGLDIDALKTVASAVNKLKSSDNAVILITHYQRLLDYIEPDFIHVMVDGKIVLSWVETEKISKKVLFFYSIFDGLSFGKKIKVPIVDSASTHAEGMPRLAIKKDGSMIVTFELKKDNPKKQIKTKSEYSQLTPLDFGKDDFITMKSK